MELRRDEHGKPVGLAWPEAPEFKPETVKRVYEKGVFSGTPWRGGRPPQEMCGKGLHDMAVHGRPRKTGGGRYCAPCKYKRQVETNRTWREKKKREREAQEAQ